MCRAPKSQEPKEPEYHDGKAGKEYFGQNQSIFKVEKEPKQKWNANQNNAAKAKTNVEKNKIASNEAKDN